MKKIPLLLLCLFIPTSVFARGPSLDSNPKLAEIFQAHLASVVQRLDVLPDFLVELATPPSSPGGGF